MRRKALGSSPLDRHVDQGKVVSRYEVTSRSEMSERVKLPLLDGKVRLFLIEDDQVEFMQLPCMILDGSTINFSSRDPLGHIAVWVKIGGSSKGFLYEDEVKKAPFYNQIRRILADFCHEERMRRLRRGDRGEIFPKILN